jgi:hypothetical protein
VLSKQGGSEYCQFKIMLGCATVRCAGKGSPNSVNLKVSASVGGAAVVLDSEDGEVLRVATEGLNFGVTMFPQVRHSHTQLVPSHKAGGLITGTLFLHFAHLLHVCCCLHEPTSVHVLSSA